MPNLSLPRLATPLGLALALAAGCGGEPGESGPRAARSDESASHAPAANGGPAAGEASLDGRSEAPEASPAGKDAGGSAPLTGQAALEALRSNVAATAAREEHQASKVTVSHILVGFKQDRMPGVERSPAEAEQRAAELFARVAAGEDFKALMSESDDPGEGTYTMGYSGGGRAYARQQMAKAFGDVSWRLEVGEVGVAAYAEDRPRESPFGWHIIKRVE